MQQNQDVLDSLLTGLPDDDRSGLIDAIRSAHAEQLDRKVHPPRRRRRNADGELVDPPAEGEDDFDETGAGDPAGDELGADDRQADDLYDEDAAEDEEAVEA